MTNTTTISACDSYTWSVNGLTYTESGTYTVVNGCSTEILVLTVTSSTSNSTNIAACDSYTWGVNGTTYTSSGTYTSTTGCHTEILVLTITTSTTNTTTISACDSYSWSVNETVYTASGTYTSVSGCHTEILVLTITQSTSNTSTISACGSYTWAVNGITYTESGTYTSTTGCHTEILVLTITPNTSSTTEASACGSYTWAVNGLTYTASGTYTSVSGCHTNILNLIVTPTPSTPSVTVVNNCDATTTLSTNAAGSLLWSNGSTASSITVSVGGTYTVVATVNGCPSAAGSGVASPVAVLQASATPAGAINCFGGSVSVTVSATGGTPTYSGTGIFTQSAGSATYTVTDANGCSSSTGLALSQPTKVEGTVTTTPSSCSTPDGTATVFATGGNPGYTYVWNPGGQTGATASNLGAGPYTVTITDSNGCTGTASGTVGGSGGTLSNPGAISGPAGACRNSSGVVYSVAPVAGATSYNWTLPTGASGSSTTNSITLSFNGTYAGGFICVTASNGCGTSAQSCMSIPVIATYASQPAPITGSQITCGPGVFTFSTSAANAVSYTWTVTGSGVFIQSGQGTNTVQVSVPAGFTQGSIQVYASNCYGNSPVRGMSLTGLPNHSNALIGPSFVCAGTSNVAYTVGNIPGVSSYSWSITGNATITGNNQNAIINFGPAWTTGVVSLTVTNSCGSYTRNYTLWSTPLQPGSISGPGTALCGQSNVTYSIAPLASATSYSWTVPAGVSIVNNTGTSITVNFTAAFTGSGNICVNGNNACGAGAIRCYAVTARPAAPVVTGPLSVCKSQSAVNYSVAPVLGATSYLWSVSGGASISPSGTSATVNYNTAISGSAIIRANAVNACGASQPGGATVNVSLFCRTADDNLDASQSFGLYPNPTNEKATISFTAGSKEKYTIKLTDLLGNVIISEVVAAQEGENTQEINVSQFAKGIYVVSLTAEDGSTQSTRLVVQ